MFKFDFDGKIYFYVGIVDMFYFDGVVYCLKVVLDGLGVKFLFYFILDCIYFDFYVIGKDC